MKATKQQKSYGSQINLTKKIKQTKANIYAFSERRTAHLRNGFYI